jgi:hypothetical protein
MKFPTNQLVGNFCPKRKRFIDMIVFKRIENIAPLGSNNLYIYNGYISV